MKVRDLVKLLCDEEDQEKEVAFYWFMDGSVLHITGIDTTMISKKTLYLDYDLE